MVALHLELSEEDYRLVAELAARRGESIADLVAGFVRQAATREPATATRRSQNEQDALVERWMRLTDQLHGHWHDPRPSIDIIDDLYDRETGLPR